MENIEKISQIIVDGQPYTVKTGNGLYMGTEGPSVPMIEMFRGERWVLSGWLHDEDGDGAVPGSTSDGDFGEGVVDAAFELLELLR